MPEKFSVVLSHVVGMKDDAALLVPDSRLWRTIVPVKEFIETVVQTVNASRPSRRVSVRFTSAADKKPYLDEPTCRGFLETLRDLGDILWYDNIGDAVLKNKVILDPTLMIDLVREVLNHKHTADMMTHHVLNHKHTADMMTHHTLSQLTLWRHLEGTPSMLSMKRVLQYFHLVDPFRGEMQADSDLIVPAYWKSNTCAFWVFGGGDLRLTQGVDREDVAVRVHWEFKFVNNLPDTLFDHVVVASFSVTYERDVGPDWILYTVDDKCACRLMLGRAINTHHRILHVEAVQGLHATDKQVTRLWKCFILLTTSMEKVIRGYPGVVVRRFALVDTAEDIEKTRYSLDSLRCDDLSELSEEWIPPQKTWEAYVACWKSD